MQFVHKSVDTKSRKICSVPWCSSYCTQDVSLHAFPSDPKLCKAWKIALKIGKPVSKYMLLCSQHFTDSDFTPATNKRRRLKKNAIPSEKIPQISPSSKKTPIDSSDRDCGESEVLEQAKASAEDIEEFKPEITFDGNIENIKDEELDILSPISTQTPSTSRASSRNESIENEEIFNILSRARSALEQIATFKDPQEEPQSANMTFAMWVGKEMDLIKDEEIIDDLYKDILKAIFRTKRAFRLKKKQIAEELY